MASRPLAVAIAVTALITAARLTGTVDSDVAWQLWTASRIHAGARLYRDIIEVNPPLWFWMALPVDSFATFFHARAEAVLTLAMGGITALSLAALNPLLTNLRRGSRTLMLSCAALILMAMPWVHLGQREQIVMIGTLPYAALIAARHQGKGVPALLAASIGIGAALGFALKHYFLIVPLLLELWLLARQGREWRWRRPEILAILGVGALYACAILVWARAYFTEIVPLVQQTYGMLKPPGLRFLFGAYALVGLSALTLAAAHMRSVARRELPITSALLVTATGFAAVYFIQAKGWIYHAIPLVGCSSFALAALLAESAKPMRMLRLAAPALLAFPLFLSATELRYPALPTPDLEASVSGLHPGDTVGFLAVETAVPWSITLQHGLQYPSRYMGYWMLNAIVSDEHREHPDARLARLGRQIIADTVTDFRCTPPKRIVVARPRPGEPGFDILHFFLRDPQFAELLSHYRVRSRTSFETFELVSPWPRVARSQCTIGA